MHTGASAEHLASITAGAQLSGRKAGGASGGAQGRLYAGVGRKQAVLESHASLRQPSHRA
jgi:hypothetical protein